MPVHRYILAKVMQKIKSINGIDEDGEIKDNVEAVCQFWTAFSILHFFIFLDPNFCLTCFGLKFCGCFGGFYIWEATIALLCSSNEGFRLNDVDNTTLNYTLYPCFDSRSCFAPIGHAYNKVLCCCCPCDLFNAPIGYHHATENRSESSGWWNPTGGTINPDEDRFCR